MVAERGRAPHGVAAVGAAVGAGGPARHQLRRRADRREGEAGGDALGHDQDVGTDAGLLHEEHVAGAGEPALDLVRDEQDPVFVADLPQSPEEGGRRRVVAALAQHRLQDHGRRLRRGGLAGQQVPDPVQGLGHGLLLGQARPHRLGERGREHAGRQRRVAGPVPRLGRGHGHGQVGATVEAALEHDHVGATGGLLGQLDRAFGGLGPGVGEEEGVDAVGRDLGQPRRQRLQQVVAVAVDLGVHEAPGLRGDGGDDLRVAVAGRHHGDAGGEVQVALAVHGGDPAPLAGGDVEVGDLEPDGSKVGGRGSLARGHGRSLRGDRRLRRRISWPVATDTTIPRKLTGAPRMRPRAAAGVGPSPNPLRWADGAPVTSTHVRRRRRTVRPRRPPRRVPGSGRHVHRTGHAPRAGPGRRAPGAVGVDGRRAVRGAGGRRRPGRGPHRERDRGHGQRHDRHARLRRRPAHPARAGGAGAAQPAGPPRRHARPTCKRIVSIPVATGPVPGVAARAPARRPSSPRPTPPPRRPRRARRRTTRRSPPSPTCGPPRSTAWTWRRPTSSPTPRTGPRFVVVARSGIPARTGHDKSSIVVYQRADRPGFAPGHPPGVRGPVDQPDAAAVATDQDVARRLLLPAGAGRTRRRRGRGRLPAQRSAPPRPT